MTFDYPEIPPLERRMRLAREWACHLTELGLPKEKLEDCFRPTGRALDALLEELTTLSRAAEDMLEEQSRWDWIQDHLPRGPAPKAVILENAVYREKLAGAFLARCAGCTLGAPVELWPIDRMQYLARQNGQAFPPVDYWHTCQPEANTRYISGRYFQYARRTMDHVPVDDDLTYTVLGLLIAERCGLEFSTEDVARLWTELLPMACTAEEVALANLKAGMTPEQAGACNNPYREWIGAGIRADPWGYLAPGNPARAAAMAYRDAFLSHRREGLYGSLFFSAAISAAFVVDNPIEAIQCGLGQIPAGSRLAEAVRWALDASESVRDHQAARQAVERRYPGMPPVHTLNNACLTVFGVAIGGTDLTRVLGETVAMGLDNDCNAATAGSLVGAVVGRSRLPEHWYAPFHNRMATYLKGHQELQIDDLLERFAASSLVQT